MIISLIRISLPSARWRRGFRYRLALVACFAALVAVWAVIGLVITQ